LFPPTFRAGFIPLRNEILSPIRADARGKRSVITSSAAFRSVRPLSQAIHTWNRAAALGSLWAAFEIVVGSFLHNLRVPFAGTVMATASVFLITAAAQVWTDKGLIWRTALVCALMKSVSPSAVLLSPMIGIFVEGVILQVSLRLLGRGWLGCAAGGALAVSYTLLQKMVSLTIIYGIDLMRVFTGLVQFASQRTGWQGLQPGGVLLALVSIQGTLGITAGLVGWYVGRRVQDTYASSPEDVARLITTQSTPRQDSAAFKRSLPVLAVWLLALPAGLWLVGTAPLSLSVPAVAVVVAAVLLRYRHTAARLSNPRLWAEILLLALLSGLVLGAAGRDTGGGLLAGARMALRAVLVVVLFAAIGVEVAHPRILRLLSRGRLAVVQAAVQSAFRALPDFLASIPNLKDVLTEPVLTMARLFRLVDRWQERFSARRRVILTGGRGEGKTTLCLALAERARRAGWTVGGIVSPCYGNSGQREVYLVKDLQSGEERVLARRSEQEGTIRVGAFAFDPDGIAFGRQALESAKEANVQLLIVDEVGPLELRGDGWAPVLQHLLADGFGVMVWVVRLELVEEVQKRYPLLAHAEVVLAADTGAEELWNRFSERG
jgi:nucleoside-triphosphatase THEP1